MKIKLTDILKSKLLTEAKIKYGLKSVSGGFNDGVDIVPGKNISAGKILINVTLYGGGSKDWHAFPAPSQVQEYINAWQEAQTTGDPISNDIEVNIEAYYSLIKKEIGINLIKALQEFDQKASQIIKSSVAAVNRRYAPEEQPEEEQSIAEPKPKPQVQAPQQQQKRPVDPRKQQGV